MTPGPWQILLIVLLILLLFGAGKLPRIMGDVAKGIKSFKKGMKEDENDTSSKDQSDEPQKTIASSHSATQDETSNTPSDKSKSEQG